MGTRTVRKMDRIMTSGTQQQACLNSLNVDHTLVVVYVHVVVS